MKTSHHDPLHQALRRSLSVSPKANPGFRGAVWARIEARRRPATWGGWLRVNLARAATFAAVGIILAGVSGGLLGARKTEHEREQSLQRYVASIDPHQREEGIP
jgi:hypothetical protein